MCDVCVLSAFYANYKASKQSIVCVCVRWRAPLHYDQDTERSGVVFNVRAVLCLG